MNLIEEVLRLDAEATKGPWKNGKPPDAVVREAQPANPHGDDVNVYYGGDLIAESISPTDKTLIIAYRTAAPKLARAVDRVKARISEAAKADEPPTEEDLARWLAEIEKELSNG